jgi:hypothetical protein
MSVFNYSLKKIRVPSPPPVLATGRIVLYSHCLDGSKGGLHFQDDLGQIIRTDADIVALQDTRWVGASLTVTTDNMQRAWSTQGEMWHKHWPGKQPRKLRHGVFLAVRAPWSRRVLSSFGDERDWGRYGGVILQGASGAVAFISLYAPCFADAADVRWQKEQIEANSLGTDPWELCRRDLRSKVMELQSAGVAVVLAGDTNTTWNLSARMNAPPASMQRHIEAWAKWARHLHLSNTMLLRDHDPTATFHRVNATNDMDAILMQTELGTACLRLTGVLSASEPGQRAPSDSEHWPVAASFNFEAALGVDGEEISGIAEIMDNSSSVKVNPGGNAGKVKVGDKAACLKFGEETARRFETGQFAAMEALLKKRTDTESDDYYSSVDDLFENILAAMNGVNKVVTAQRAGAWRKFNDDGATAFRKELSAVRSVMAVTHERSGHGRRTRTLNMVLDKHPSLAARLDLSKHEVEAWSQVTTSSETLSKDIAVLRDKAKRVAEELSATISKVARDNTRRDFVNRATKKDGRGRRCLRTLTNVVMARAAKAGHYASLVQEDTSTPNEPGEANQGPNRARPRMRVTSNKEEVARGLVSQFYSWMGGGRSWWYSDTPLDSETTEGKDFRRAILDGTLTDSQAATIPARFRSVVKALRRVEGAHSGLYSNLMNEITTEEWTQKIKSTKKGTAAGLSGETIDMLAALDPACSDLLRRVVNLMLRSRRAFSQWKRRAICPVPKIIGNPDVGLSRPLTLLSVSGKVFWSVMSDRMTLIWKEHELLQRQQYGFRRGVSIDEPLIIATLAAEQCYDLRQPLITASQDISKAFDSVSRGLKALAFGRLGVPEEFCDMFATMDVDNRTVVLTAYGTSETILGEDGVFECARGYAQGCTTSANIGWTSFYDILLTLQNTLGIDDGTFRAIGDELGECDRSTMAFADDAFYMAGGPCTSSPRRSIELKLAVASLFFDFTGIKFNAQKTECCAMEWAEDATAFTTAENEGWCPWTYDLDVLFAGGDLCLLPVSSPGGSDHICAVQFRRESIKMVPVPDGLRYLGVWSSPRLDTEITQRWVVETADEIIERVRQVPVDAAATRFLLEQVLWAKVGYRLRYERFAVGAFDALERRVRELLLHRARLGVRMSKDAAAIPAVLGGPDIAAWRDLVMADRLRVVQRQLDENTTAAPLLRAAITRCQEKFGSSQLVFESNMAKDPGWLEGDSAEHGWIESLAVWCSEKGIELRGGHGLPGAASDDAAIVDLVRQEFTEADDDVGTLARKHFLRTRRLLQQASFEMDQHFVSDFLLLDGRTTNLDAVHFVKNRGAVRSFLRKSLTPWESTPIPRLRGNDVKAGDTILVRSAMGEVQLAEVISVSGTDVRVDYLERAHLKATKAVTVGDSVFAKKG